MTIHVLKMQGHSIQAIAHETGISRNSVKKYLNQEISNVPSYKIRPPKESKLAPFKAYLQGRIRSAHPDWIPASVLFKEILEQGYTGKIRILSDYLSTLRPTKQADPLVRFETQPGQQMQVDFTIIRRGVQPLKAFVATLGYSRASFVCFFDNERRESWLEGLKQSFEFFGGVPKEVLFDNAKSIILERDAYGLGEHRWNPCLVDFAKTYGFVPKVCRPYRAKTKGKVERFNRYLKSSFIVPLQATFKEVGLQLDVQTANSYIGKWLEQTANARIHGTTQEIPAQRLQQERHMMLPLPIWSGSQDEAIPISLQRQPIPVESLQHPLSVYDGLLGALR